MKGRQRRAGRAGKPGGKVGKGRKPGRGRTRRPRPVDADGVLEAIERRGRRPTSAAAIGRTLGIQRDAARRLKRPLTDLIRLGVIERVPAGYRMRRRDGLVEGVLEQSSRGRERGGGLVRDDGGREWSVQTSSGTPDARVGDRVLLLPRAEAQRGQKGRGELLHVLAGARDSWVGILHIRSRRAVVSPYRDDADWVVHVSSEEVGEGRDGDVVVVLPLGSSSPSPRRREARTGIPRGRVVEVLGRPGDPDADTRAVAWRHRWPLEFSAAALREAEALEAGSVQELPAGRRDLRDRCFVTIDPESARDFDDAVCAEPLDEGGTRLWVAIADVAHFVLPGSAIDAEAHERGFSVYFPERAIPMLPERLSSDLCSLRPRVDRLAMVVELSFDSRGKRVGRRFHEGIIHSRERLSYAQAASRMAGHSARQTRAGAEGVDECLANLDELTGKLERRRRKEGSLELEIPEPRVVIGSDGKVVDVVRASRTGAHRMVEEAMLAANRAVAEGLAASDHPTIQRVHPPPDDRSMARLREVLLEFGLEEEAQAEVTLRNLARALARVAGRPEQAVVHSRVLQTLSQAHYAVDRGGHFALGFGHYTHFTSPIRRYADLMVHRALKAVMQTPRDGPAYPLEIARRVARRTSWRERLAIQAERERIELSRCALMSGRVGQSFSGVVTGIASHGLYVTLDEPFVEGLVHTSRLPGPTHFDERRRELSLGRSAQRFRMGDRVRVRLMEVDALKTRIDFALDPAAPPGAR